MDGLSQSKRSCLGWLNMSIGQSIAPRASSGSNVEPDCIGSPGPRFGSSDGPAGLLARLAVFGDNPRVLEDNDGGSRGRQRLKSPQFVNHLCSDPVVVLVRNSAAGRCRIKDDKVRARVLDRPRSAHVPVSRTKVEVTGPEVLSNGWDIRPPKPIPSPAKVLIAVGTAVLLIKVQDPQRSNRDIVEDGDAC